MWPLVPVQKYKCGLQQLLLVCLECCISHRFALCEENIFMKQKFNVWEDAMVSAWLFTQLARLTCSPSPLSSSLFSKLQCAQYKCSYRVGYLGRIWHKHYKDSKQKFKSNSRISETLAESVFLIGKQRIPR